MNPVDPKAVQSVLQSFVTSRHLNYRRTRDPALRRLNEHKAFFVMRRAQWLLAHGPAAWGGESGHVSVIKRIDSEFTALDAFATAKLGRPGHPGTLTGAGGDLTPGHLDLADVAQRRTSDPATTVADALKSRDNPVKRRTAQFLQQRRERGLTIIWRAGGIHANLWEPSADQSTATLREAAMAEILDRRLHAVERMNYQISTAQAMGGAVFKTDGQTDGPWTDGLRVRMFEYPRLPKSFAAIVGTVAPEQGQLPAGVKWRWETARHRRMVWAIPPGHRFRDAADPAFPLFGGNYTHALWPGSGGMTPAQAMDALYTPATNYWDRSWIYCDHVVSSLHLMALLFAKRRRTGDDKWFNDIVTTHSKGYVPIGPLLQTSEGSTDHRLMDSGPEPDPDAQPPPPPPDPAFQNMLVAPADLEIGDHLIFWNSVLYPLVANGEWQLENALIVGIDSDPERGSIKLRQLRMQGHGTFVQTVGQYENSIGAYLDAGMSDARDAAKAAPSGATSIPFNNQTDRLVRWSPYGDKWTSPGAWWVRVPVKSESPDTVVKRLRKGVAANPAFLNQPPFSDSVYFPLWEPKYKDGWTGYLAARAQGAVRVSPRLTAVAADGAVIPGLHYQGGEWDPLPVVRPRVTP